MSEARARVGALVRQAKNELHAGNRDEALSLLKKALAMDPGSSAVTEVIMAMEKESAAASAPDLKPTPKQVPQQKQAEPARPAARTEQAKPAPKQAEARQEPPRPAARPAEARQEPPKPSARPAEQKAAVQKPAVSQPTAARQVEPRPAAAQARPQPAAAPQSSRPAESRMSHAIPMPPPSPAPQKEQRAAEKRAPDETPSPRPASTQAAKPPQEARPPQEKPAQQARSVAPRASEEEPQEPKPAAKVREQKTEETRPARPAPPEPKAPEKKQETPLEEKILALFQSSEKALAAGDESGALNCLKQARDLAPEDPEVKSRIKSLQRKLKAENLVHVGVRKLSEKAYPEAYAAAREAFDLWPLAPGLADLVAGLEKAGGVEASSTKAVEHRAAEPAKPHVRRAVDAPPSDEYVRRVREQIQLSAFPAAAGIAAEGLEIYPDHELLMTFVQKFQKMGLLPKTD